MRLVFAPRAHQWYVVSKRVGIQGFPTNPLVHHEAWDRGRFGEAGIRFGSFPILTNEMSFKVDSKLLGIPLLLAMDTKGYFGPTASPQMHIKWLQSSIP